MHDKPGQIKRTSNKQSWFISGLEHICQDTNDSPLKTQDYIKNSIETVDQRQESTTGEAGNKVLRDSGN